MGNIAGLTDENEMRSHSTSYYLFKITTSTLASLAFDFCLEYDWIPNINQSDQNQICHLFPFTDMSQRWRSEATPLYYSLHMWLSDLTQG